MIKFINGLLPKRLQNNHGFWGALFAGVGSALGLASSLTKNDKVEQHWLQNPEYPEAEGARKNWWETLQKWGQDPNYGAISPDWENIWQTVQRQVREYYSGGPLTTGMRDKLKASVARRNMSDQPASDYLMMASYADEANKMKDIATEQGTLKAELAEKGRTDWLNSLQNLSQQKPSGQWSEPVIKSNRTSDILGSVGEFAGGIGSSMVNYQNWGDYLDAIKKGEVNDEIRKDTPQAVSDPFQYARV